MGFNKKYTFGLVGKSGSKKKAAPQEPPPVAATIDSAEQGSINQRERLRQRRGVLANIFAGRSTLG